MKEIVEHFQRYDNNNEILMTPAGEHLFKTCNEATLLPEKQATVFHHFVTKSMFATKRAQWDISTAVAFLTTCV